MNLGDSGKSLMDSHGRVHDYLRISLTDQCNFRCLYCMPQEQIKFLPGNQLMSAKEILQLATLFTQQGIRKIRLTGGEPLVRKDAKEIILNLAQLPVELTLTSNGYHADTFLSTFQEAKIRSINISLDSLNAAKFKAMTQREAFEKVWQNILLLLDYQFHVKLNVVLIKGKNEEEISDFIALTKDLPIHVRFIEFMPFTGNAWDQTKVVTHQQILGTIDKEFTFNKIADEKHDTAKKYQVNDYMGTFAIISTMSEPFCGDCNRLRLTADGKLKNCLFSAEESDLLSNLRKGENILPTIQKTLQKKHLKLGGQFADTFEKTNALQIENRSMINIGG